MLINSITPAAAQAMAQATERVRESLNAEPLEARSFVTDGIVRVRAAIDTYANGGRLANEAAARLGMALTVLRIRDEAWTLIDDRACHLVLWKDLTRRLVPAHAAPAASLLAAAAWECGDHELARAALDRALETNPGYTMAQLIETAMERELCPAFMREKMPTPEDLDREMGEPRPIWLFPLMDLLA